LLSFKNADGTTLAASAAAGKFGISNTFGTATYLIGEAANTNTKTDDAVVEYVLPQTYIAGTNLTLTSNVSVAGAGTPGTKTFQAKVRKVASAGTHSRRAKSPGGTLHL
jgi:hypothetical protein